jgi:hypothetical protein
MTDDRATPWVLQYRVSVSDTPTPSLDQAILAAAGRYLARRRATRQSGAWVIAVFAMLAIYTVWQRGQPTFQPQTVADFGRLEGISSRYLMQVQTRPFSGFGIDEVSP